MHPKPEHAMNYLLFICSDNETEPEEGVFQRETPRWVEEMDRRGVRLLGRELELPETAATVRVRDGETLVSDGPFAETKEFMAGFDLLECADLDEAIEVAAKHPSSWFHTIEIRPFVGGVQLGDEASAFARGEDGDASPYLLIVWMGGASAAPLEGEAATRDIAAWRRNLEERGLHVLGDALAGTDAATTVRVRGGETLLDDGPFTETEEVIAAIDVVSCADRGQAIELAAAHPIARHHAIEVRPFYSE